MNPFAGRLEVPLIHSLLIRATTLGSVHALQAVESQPMRVLHLRLPVEEWGLLELKALDEIAARGYEASLEPLQRWAAENLK